MNTPRKIRKPVISGNFQLRLANGCIASYCPVASSLGLRVLHEGGNAVDAAVATGLALAVTYPQAGNLGGGGFMLIKSEGREPEFLDYRETAPRLSSPSLFKDDSTAGLFGAKAVAVPGTVAGLSAALERHGTWSWDRVVERALALAENGVWVTSRQASYYRLYKSDFERYESTKAALFTDNGEPPGAGTLHKQPDLAWTLRQLAEHGSRAFYEGTIAEKIIAEIRNGGGVLDAEDLRNYQVRWRAPFRRKAFGREILTSALPSGGGLVVSLALGALDAAGLSATVEGSVDRYQLLARAFRAAFAARRELAGDPDHMTVRELAEVRELVETKMDSSFISHLEKSFVLARLPSVLPPARNTTHFCVIDAMGNAVSNTYSLNTLFGSKLVVGGAGFWLNNSMDDFQLEKGAPNWYGMVEGTRTQLAPGKRPTGSMSPTLVLNNGVVEYVVGASGGPHIPTLIVQLLTSCLVDGHSLPEAMLLPRVHHQYVPDILMVERDIDLPVCEQLRELGYTVEQRSRLGIGIGIHRDASTDRLSTMLDYRFNCGLTL